MDHGHVEDRLREIIASGGHAEWQRTPTEEISVYMGYMTYPEFEEAAQAESDPEIADLYWSAAEWMRDEGAAPDTTVEDLLGDA